jgi:hypothetical protein
MSQLRFVSDKDFAWGWQSPKDRDDSEDDGHIWLDSETRAALQRTMNRHMSQIVASLDEPEDDGSPNP